MNISKIKRIVNADFSFFAYKTLSIIEENEELKSEHKNVKFIRGGRLNSNWGEGTHTTRLTNSFYFRFKNTSYYRRRVTNMLRSKRKIKLMRTVVELEIEDIDTQLNRIRESGLVNNDIFNTLCAQRDVLERVLDQFKMVIGD